MNKSKKILVTGESVGATYLDLLRSEGFEIINPEKSFPPSILDEDELTGILTDCSAYICGGDEWASKTAMQAAKNLKVVAFLGVGYQSFVDAEGARELGIPVTNTPGTYANSVAEFTIGMLLDRRRLILDYAEVFRGENEILKQKKRYDLAGHPIGIYGMGHIGKRIAEILRLGFNAEVFYSNRTRKNDVEERLGLHYKTLEELVSEVESLIVMVPEEPSTTGILNDDIFDCRDSSRPGLHVIDTSRPEIIDPKSLLNALESGRIENVALDGFYREETKETEIIRNHPQVLITPHVASLTHDARDAMSQMCVNTVLRILKGETDPNIVNAQ